MASLPSRSALSGLEPTLRAVTEAVVPRAAALTPGEWSEVERIVERTLLGRPARMIRQLRVFVRALDALAFVTRGRPFRRVDAEGRARLLRRLQDAPVLLLRRGAWGVRALALAGYYGRPAAAREVGYAASVGRQLVP